MAQDTRFVQNEFRNFAYTAEVLTGIIAYENYNQSLRYRNVLDIDKFDLDNYISCNNSLVKTRMLLDYLEKNSNKISDNTDSLKVNLYKTQLNLLFPLHAKKYYSGQYDGLVDTLYKRCEQNLNIDGVENILKEICMITNKPMPRSYILIPSLIDNLDSNIIPDSLKFADEGLLNIFINESVKLSQDCYELGDYQGMISALYNIAYYSPYALRLLGIACYQGLGVKNNKEYTLKLLNYAAKMGDNNISNLLIGEICEEEEMYEKAFTAYSKSNYYKAKIRLARMYKKGLYVQYDISKAIDILLLLRDSGNMNDDDIASEINKELLGLAAKMNHFAYEDAYAGDLNKALDEINLAISISPDSGELYDSKGEINLWMGNTNEAVQNWETAQKLNPEIINTSSLYKKLLSSQVISK